MPVHSGIMTAVSQMVCRALTRRSFVCAAHRVYNCMHDIDKLTCLFQDFRVILLNFYTDFGYFWTVNVKLIVLVLMQHGDSTCT